MKRSFTDPRRNKVFYGVVGALIFTLWMLSGESTTDEYTEVVQEEKMEELRGEKKNEVQTEKTICVFWPHFNNPDYLEKSILSHTMRQSDSGRILVKYFVLTMEEETEKRKVIRKRFHSEKVSVIDFPQPSQVRGGRPLPDFLRQINKYNTGCDITVSSDVDSFMLATGWDETLTKIFSKENTVLAAINPRSASTPFKNKAEWNWMAFQSQFYYDYIFLPSSWENIHDWGEAFSNLAEKNGKQVFLWKKTWSPISGRSPQVVGDGSSSWVLHLFYSTRKQKEEESLKNSGEDKHIASEEQARLLMEWALQETPKEEQLREDGA
jgi:hypothetical protein